MVLRDPVWSKARGHDAQSQTPFDNGESVLAYERNGLTNGTEWRNSQQEAASNVTAGPVYRLEATYCGWGTSIKATQSVRLVLNLTLSDQLILTLQ